MALQTLHRCDANVDVDFREKKEAWPGNKRSNEIISRFYIEGTVVNSILSLITIMVMIFQNDL